MDLPTAEDFMKMRLDGSHPVELCRASLDFSDLDMQGFAEQATQYYDDILKRVPEDIAPDIRALSAQEKTVFLVAYADGIKSIRHKTNINQCMSVLMASMIAYFQPDEASLVLAAASQFACDWVADDEGEEAAVALMDMIKLSAVDMMSEAEEKDPELLAAATKYLQEKGLI